MKPLNDLTQQELTKRIQKYISNKSIQQPIYATSLVSAHLQKAFHNYRFANTIIGAQFNDWKVVVLYYAVYHSALALIASRGFTSKSHEATIILLAKYFIPDISKEEIAFINKIAMTKEDASFYVSLKKKRSHASYSTSTLFTDDDIQIWQEKTLTFIQKAQLVVQATT